MAITIASNHGTVQSHNLEPHVACQRSITTHMEIFGVCQPNRPYYSAQTCGEWYYDQQEVLQQYYIKQFCLCYLYTFITFGLITNIVLAGA